MIEIEEFTLPPDRPRTARGQSVTTCIFGPSFVPLSTYRWQHPEVPAKAEEVGFWVRRAKRAERAVLLLRAGEGILCLPRRGAGSRQMIPVLPSEIERLRRDGWQDFRTHMLPPRRWFEFVRDRFGVAD